MHRAAQLKAWGRLHPPVAAGAFSLPRELLSGVFQRAALTQHRGTNWRDLRELVRFGLVCREWRAAAELAAQTCASGLELDAETPSSVCSSAAVQRWAPHLRWLDVDLCNAPSFPGSLRTLIQRACKLDHVLVWGCLDVASRDAAINMAFCKAALACSVSMQSLNAHHYVPSALPASLVSLRVNLCGHTFEHVPPGAVEVLLVHCQNLGGLQELDLNLQGHGQAQLSAERLSGVCLTSLQRLGLRVTVAETSDLDLSFLAQPRSFQLTLHVWRGDGSSSEVRSHIVSSAAAAMQRPDDCLTIGLQGGSLIPAEKRALAESQADRCAVYYNGPELVDWAPAACKLHLGLSAPFNGPVQTVRLDMTALSPRTHSVLVELQGAVNTLQVLGFEAVVDRPWQLCVAAASVLEGLPSPVQGSRLCYQTCSTQTWEPQPAYFLRNQAAVDLGDWNPWAID